MSMSSKLTASSPQDELLPVSDVSKSVLPDASAIEYVLPRAGNVSLGIYNGDILIRTLFAGDPQDAGTHTVAWDGLDRWTKFTYTRNAKILSVEIDPDHTILLDKDPFNNSYVTTPNNIPARKLSNIWLSFQQLLAQLSTWIV